MRFYGFSSDEINWIQAGLSEIHSLGNELSLSVSFNHDERFGIPEAKINVLVLYEPPCVMPWQYSKECLSTFDLVICLNPWRAQRLGFREWEYQPIVKPEPRRIYMQALDRELKVVMINANKFSAISGSGYRLRRETIVQLEKTYSGFHLYGVGWDMNRLLELRKRFAAIKEAFKARSTDIDLKEALSEFGRKYSSFKGSPRLKEEVLERAEICLVIENDFNTLSEKVFDAIYSGSVPLYVGPDLTSIEGLADCVITAEPDARKILKTLEGLSFSDLQKRRKAIEKFINSPTSMDFCAPSKVWKNVGRIIAGSHLY